jgi:hypothetical protein
MAYHKQPGVHMFLVLADTSGSITHQSFMEVLNFAKSIDARFAMFDTELRSLPVDASRIDSETLEVLGQGGTDVERALLGLEAINPITYASYTMIYVASDMYFVAPEKARLDNVRFVQTTPMAGDENDAATVRTILQRDLKGRASVVPIATEQLYRNNLKVTV